jgi:predicted transcriptional regulator
LGYSKSGYILVRSELTASTMPKHLTKEKLVSSLVQMRKEAGLTQEQLAKNLGKPQSFISKYENSERSLDFIEVIEAIEAIGADPTEEIRKLLQS